jgi:uncharacterized protein YndB with AHSA1/START domain
MLDLDPALDLQIDRYLDTTPDKVWRCWTEPALICQWFCPKPWTVSEAIVDLRPGGRFFSLMHGPAGEVMPNDGALLDVVPNRRLVFTDLFLADWRPAASPGLGFAGIVTMEPEGQGTRYRAMARHRIAAEAETHASMGFHQGWTIAADQLVEVARSL